MTAAQRLDDLEARLADLEARFEAASSIMEFAFAAGRASITDAQMARTRSDRSERHLTVVTR